MDSNTSVSSFRIPIWVWVIVAAIVIGGIAVFGFNVPLTTVGTYGFFILMMGSHFFMHGSHGGHGGNENHSAQNVSQSKADPTQKANDQQGHSGGCH